jgi:hypothetical protein
MACCLLVAVTEPDLQHQHGGKTLVKHAGMDCINYSHIAFVLA